MLQKCAFENFPKIAKKSFERLQSTQGVPKSFWRKFRGFLSKHLKILCFVQFLGTLYAAFYMARSKKRLILAYFLPILRWCSPKGCTQSIKKVHKNQNFLDFVQKSSKLFPDTFWTSQGTLEARKCFFCDFLQNLIFASPLKIVVVSKVAENTRGWKKFNFDFCDFGTFWWVWDAIWGRRAFFYPFRPKIQRR